MDYEQIVAYVENAKVFGSKLGLHNISYLMELLGNPQDSLRFVHIAGTNGKGSTASYISNVLTAAGYKTGLYTSPHIESFNDRMSISGTKIDNESVVKAGNAVIDMINKMTDEGMDCPTEFEIVTAMAFVYFYNEKCDIVVLEVGLGGRLDCTNVINSAEVAVIAPIDFDHTKELGGTIDKITFEKAGIIKQNASVASSRQRAESESILKEVCIQRGAELTFADYDSITVTGFSVPSHKDGAEAYQTFTFGEYGEIRLSILGDHQVRNAVLAITALEALIKKGWNISKDAIKDGLLKARWNGRFEIVKTNPVIVIDGAHNPQGTTVLAQNLKKYFKGYNIRFITGVLADKDYEEMLAPILPLGDCFYTVTPYNDRALRADKLADILTAKGKRAVSFHTLEDAVEEAQKSVASNEIICCFGSLYYIGRARQLVTVKNNRD